jgi:tetratricopeptide (TPR) repeat protein
MQLADDLASLLATGERAAFHGRPAAGIDPLQRAVTLADEGGLPTESAAARWLLGVCLAAAGRFGSALVALAPLVQVGPDDPPERRLLGALGEASLASVHRQLGRHADARTHDELALAASGGAGEAGFDAHLGLAADAVGLGEIDAARAGLAAAGDLTADRPEWWRQRVRLGWVQAEVALLLNNPEEAITTAATAVDLAEHSGAPRHVAKGLLFQGVAQVEAGRPDEAAGTLRRAGLLAESLSALPLLWPVRAVLGALLDGSDPAQSQAALSSARRAVGAIADDLPQDLREPWLARPDVAALLAP